MITYLALNKDLIEDTFDNYPWYEKLLIFLTEICPVFIIYYGIWLSSDRQKKKRGKLTITAESQSSEIDE